MLAVLLTVVLGLGQVTEHVTDVRVQGNTLTADADIVALSGVSIGAEATPTLLDDVAARLRKSGRFHRVEVLRRYASIADASQILVVIIVDEGRVGVRAGDGGAPATTVRRRGPPLMFLPLIGSEDG